MIITPGQSLSHYRLLEKIGEGGMGVVWKAEDTLLRRQVAIKVLPPDAARDDARRRMFLDEARLASSLSDAHIAQVHELGREGDLDFIAMEYVEGKPLSALLRGRPLPAEKVASLGLQVAQALSRAHRKRLLHRDLKPGNILVTADEEVKVVDFGLATLFERPELSVVSEMPTQSAIGEALDPAGGAKGAEGRRLVGTLPYMSPEQARAEQLDARSDIFSLGIVLYEMTTGQRPFFGRTPSDLLEEIVRARPRPPHEVAPRLPLDLERIIMKALAPARADRYQTMEDLAVDLKRLGRDLESGSSPSYGDLRSAPDSGHRKSARTWALSGAGVLLITATATAFWLLGTRGGGRANPHTILIAPLDVRGQTEGADYVGRAFAEAIAVNLAGAKDLNVLPVPEAGEFGTGGSLARARAALSAGAGRLLTGALTRDGSRLHASLSLVDTAQNRILWGTQKEVPDGSLPALAGSLARDLAAEMGAGAPRLYDFFLYFTGTKAMATIPDFHEALSALRQQKAGPALESTRRLIQAFPNESEARVLRAYALLIAFWEFDSSSPQRREFEKSLVDIDRVDPKNPWDDIFRGLALTRDGRFQESIDLFNQVLARDDLTPGARGNVLSLRAQDHSNLGHSEPALADLEEAVRLDPANNITFEILSMSLAGVTRLDEAVNHARHALALNPEEFQAHWTLGLALYKQGGWQEAAVHFGKACEIHSVQSWCAMHAVALLRAGDNGLAREAADKAASLSESPEGAYGLACYWALSADKARAVHYLRRALDSDTYRRHEALLDLEEDPDLLSLRHDPEFKASIADAERRLPKN